MNLADGKIIFAGGKIIVAGGKINQILPSEQSDTFASPGLVITRRSTWVQRSEGPRSRGGRCTSFAQCFFIFLKQCLKIEKYRTTNLIVKQKVQCF